VWPAGTGAVESPRRAVAGSSRRLLFTFVPLLVIAVLPARAGALSLEHMGNFDSPTYVTSDPDDADRLFVVERSGRIELVDNGATDLFLDIEAIVLSPPDDDAVVDHGLYSMAFSPDYAKSHLFYVAYSGADDPDTASDESGDWHVDEFSASGDTADPASRREVLTVKYPPSQRHYGGQLQFGPDGYLYASIGDGGPQGDTDGNAQSIQNLHGKILRIDPRGSVPGEYSIPADNPFAGPRPGEDEIWSYGLRNPWRFSFDRLTGALVIGDVGLGSWEEVDLEPPPDPGRGDNFGWNCREGAHPFSTAPPCDAPQALTEPVFEYQHGAESCSAITGGYVVRDTSLGDVYGRYLYADYCAGQLRSLDLGPSPLDRSEGVTVPGITSFGEDSSCRIYVASIDGPVYRLTDAGSSGACPPPAPPSSDPPLSDPPLSESPPPGPPAGAPCGGEQATILGSPGPETLRGTQGHDVIAGLGGRDTVRGLAGNDIICGGGGRDRLSGGPGDDALLGGSGRDQLLGGAGRDRCEDGTARETATSCAVDRQRRLSGRQRN
jgi:glucose/arabinose dehydrogenase